MSLCKWYSREGSGTYRNSCCLFTDCCGCESCGGVTGNSGGAHRSASSAILSLHSFPPNEDSGMNNNYLGIPYYLTQTALSHDKVKNYIPNWTNSSVELRQKLPSRVIDIKIESGGNKRLFPQFLLLLFCHLKQFITNHQPQACLPYLLSTMRQPQFQNGENNTFPATQR